MTPSKAHQAAEEYQNKGCIGEALVIENVRTKWAKQDFIAGAEWQKSQDAKKLMVAKEALYWAKEMLLARDVMNSNVHCAPVRFSPLTERLRQALEEIDKLE